MVEQRKYSIIRQSVKFLNNCHKCLKEKDISSESFNQLIGNKLAFLDEVLKEEGKSLYAHSTMRTRT